MGRSIRLPLEDEGSEEAVCGKLCHESKHAAKVAHKHAHFRIRVYYCDGCHAWHVTNNEKR